MTISKSFTITLSNPTNSAIVTGSANGIIRRVGVATTSSPTPTPSSTTSIVQWGDSMTFYVGAQLLSNTLGDGRRVVNKGIPGQRSAEIAGRQGGLPTSCRIVNEIIPSSGIASVTALGPSIARGVTPALGPLEVQIAGVSGNLRPVGDVNNPTGYEFSRIGTGSSVSAPSSQPVIPVTTDIVNDTVFDLNDYSSILWLGRNGVGDSRETDVTVYQKMIAKMTNPNKLVIILPIFNGGFTNESLGLSGYTSRMTRNDAIAEAFPSYWYDVRRDFIDGAKAWMQTNYPVEYARDWGLAFSSSRADTGPDSDWDVDNDVPPRALRRDKIHPNSMGSQFLAELISKKIREMEAGGTGVEEPTPPPPVVLPTVTLSVSPTSVQESGSASLVFTFTRTGSTANNLVVNYTVGGTATLGTDYTGIPSAGSIKTVTIPVGSLTAAVVVSPIADDIVEPNETVILTIATGSGYIVGTSTPVTGTIINSSTSVSPTDTLPAFSPTSVNPNLFQGEEYIYGPPLRNLSQLANAVKMDEPNRGFITIPVWRPPVNNVPGNARVLENHTSLTFFYTVDRPWNIYRGNLILRARLEAILEFLISSVNLTLGTGNVDGTNQSIARLGSDKVEGAPNNNELAGSTFGVKYLGETLMMLEQSRLAGGPVIDENLRQRLISTMRVLIKTCLGFLSFKVSATRFSNQYTGSWGGILAYLSAYDDPEIRQLLITRLAKLADKDNPELITWSGSTFPFQLSSPAGYHYENSGPEWGYVFSTHYPNINHVLGLDQSSSIVDPIVAMEEPWFEWKAYNSVREPDGSVFVVNRAIQTRIVRYGGFQYEESKLAEYIPLARAFMRTDTEHQALVSSERQKMINGWNNPPGTLTSYPPHTFAGKGRPERGFWRPSEAQRSAAIASLPYLASTAFVHQRRDSKATVTFVRRPSYYAIFNSGTSTSANIPRYGLGLIWNPQMGSVLQTQSGNVSYWGTSRDASTPPLPHEAAPFTPTIKINGQTQVEQTGVRDLPNGASGLTTFEYGLFDGGQKTVTFNSNKIDVNVTLTGVFLEHLTLITKTRSSSFTGSISGDTLTVTSVASGTLSVNDWVFGSGIAANTRITQRLTGNGTVGTYRLSNSQTVASRTMETNVDNLTVSSGVIRLIRGANTFEITFPTSVSVIQRTVGGYPPPGFIINRLFLKSSNTLSYSMAFT